ncbi:ribonuclease PH [Entomobacter blattae]|uniref:Ribonuclease PH n=1 Tax=Entomobacter blattae TaxID=2762277 RepID=A0A7H1NP32_9PROT|nr:ribonuclease PH [Entomobacter blattae]QNT77542.1 Ribonuclease PH [Entomobacter blattae]
MRFSGRARNALRPVSIEPGFAHHAEGSVLIRMGNTEVICAATVENKVPPFLRNQGLGWVTAEYGMLPRSTHTRTNREAAKGKQSGRTQEIQRLIGRSLRAVVNRKLMGEMTITLDCDVINADGGTRCASITGAWVALHLAFDSLLQKKALQHHPITGQIAAVSCGLDTHGPLLDLDYQEDSSAATDANFILTADNRIVEIQMTAEEKPFSSTEMHSLLALAQEGTQSLFTYQNKALHAEKSRKTA